MSKCEMVRLGDVCDILDNQRVPITACDRKKGEYPYYGANGVQDYIDDYIFDDELVLVAEDGGNFGSKERPIAYRVSGKCWVNNHAHVLKAKDSVKVDYLCYALMFYDVSDIINGATRQKLNQAALRKMKIGLPSLEEQKKIAAELDKISDLITKRKAQIEKLDLLVKAKFIEMFGDPVTNPMGWEIKTWHDIFNTTTGKLDSNAMNVNGKYPFFTCAKESFFIDSYAFDCEALLLAGNNAAGVYDVKYYKGKFNAYQRTYVLTLKNVGWSCCFYKYQLESKLAFLQTQSKGTNTKYLTLTILAALTFLNPPVKIQDEFTDYVQSVEATKTKLQEGLAQLELLYKQRMQYYFG